MAIVIKPREHQKEFMDFFNRPNAMMGTIAWHGMGLGKTLTSLWLARDHLKKLRDMGIENPKFMVIMPKSALSVWKVECHKNTPDLYKSMVLYPYSQLHSAIKSLKYLDIRMIIFDECHYLKAPDTDRIKRLADLFNELYRVNRFAHGRIIGGTGTPTPNTASEWYIPWAMCCAPTLAESASRILDSDRFESWRHTFSQKKSVSWTVGKRRPKEQQRRGHATKYVGIDNEDKLAVLLQQFVHFKRVEDCIDLPESQEFTVDLGLPDDKLLKDANIEEPEAYTALVERLSRAKTPHMLAWVKEFLEDNDEQLVVFAMNRHPIEELVKAYPNHVRLVTGAESNVQRATNIKDFQDGKFRIIAMTYAAGSEALNLQNARYSLYHGYFWTDAKIKQAMARTKRQGQARNTFHYFLVSGENDKRILSAVRTKEETTTTIENLLLNTNKILSLDDLI